MPGTKRTIRPEDVYRLRSIQDPQVSPDGRWVACVISQADRQKDRWLSDIWLISTDGKKRLQLTNRHHRDSSPRWSPDGTRIAFLSPEKDDERSKPQLWVIPAGGGEARQITQLKQGLSSPAWSPDGKRIAFLARNPKREDDEQEADKPKIEVKHGRVFATDVRVIDRIRYRSSTFLPKEERRHIYIISATGGRPRKITDGDCDDSEPTWSPDGTRIAFVSNRGRDPDWDLTGDIWIVPAQGGDPRRLSTLAGGASNPAWSPDGKHVAYIGSPAPEVFRLEDRIWLQPADGGKARGLTQSHPGYPHSLRWSPDGGAVYFQCIEEGFNSLWRVDTRAKAVRILAKQRCVDGYSIARDAGTIAFLLSAPDHPAELYVCGPDGEAQRRLTQENRALLRQLRLGTTEAFWCRSADGTPVHAWLVRPPGFRADRRYPLVLQVHGGPYAAYLETWKFDAQVLAAQGFLVVYSNPRGSTGYGKEFQTAIVGRWGVLDSQDVLAAVDHVVGQGSVDPQRLGVMGASYGGFMTTWLVGTTDRFAGAVASCAATDERMFYYSADMPKWSEEEIGGPPWERAADYARMSSSSHAHKIRTPILLLHADDDTRVPISHSEIIFTTVKRLGVESVFVRYPTGGHGFGGHTPRYTCDTLNRAVDWLTDHLKGQRAPSGRKPRAR